jgi:hypothetical protein
MIHFEQDTKLNEEKERNVGCLKRRGQLGCNCIDQAKLNVGLYLESSSGSTGDKFAW